MWLVGCGGGNDPITAPSADEIGEAFETAAVYGLPQWEYVEDLLHNSRVQVEGANTDERFAETMRFVRANVISVDGWYSACAEPRDDGSIYSDDFYRCDWNGEHGFVKIQLDVEHSFGDDREWPEWVWMEVLPDSVDTVKRLVAIDDAVIQGVYWPPRMIEEDDGTFFQAGSINPIRDDGTIEWSHWGEDATSNVKTIEQLEAYGNGDGQMVVIADDTYPPAVVERIDRD